MFGMKFGNDRLSKSGLRTWGRKWEIVVVVDVAQLVRVLIEVRKEVHSGSAQRAVSPAMPIDAVSLQDRVAPHCLDEVPHCRMVPKARHVDDLKIVIKLIRYR